MINVERQASNKLAVHYLGDCRHAMAVIFKPKSGGEGEGEGTYDDVFDIAKGSHPARNGWVLFPSPGDPVPELPVGTYRDRLVPGSRPRTLQILCRPGLGIVLCFALHNSSNYMNIMLMKYEK